MAPLFEIDPRSTLLTAIVDIASAPRAIDWLFVRRSRINNRHQSIEMTPDGNTRAIQDSESRK